MNDREKPVNWLAQYIGITEGSSEHNTILSIFNNSGLCKRYKITTNDAWCAASVSAAFIATGLSSIFPCIECSCENMVVLAKQAGIWIENDNFVPSTGDVILYDWDDSGVDDCTGWSDHIGIVVSVNNSVIRVIEGNMANSVGYRNISVNGRFIRGFITPNYTDHSSSSKKTVDEVATEVIMGLWGNGSDRKEALSIAGYDYLEIQEKVNELIHNNSSSKKSIPQIAKEVINGIWGNNPDRKDKLIAAGYDYDLVQEEVNRLLKLPK